MIPLTEHLRIVKEKDQKIHYLQKQLRYRDELDSVPATIMSQNQKAALSRTVKEIEASKPGPDGWFLLPDTNELSKSVGQSPKTYQKCLTYCDAIGNLEKKTKQVRDEDTKQVLYTETYVKPTNLTPYPRLYEAEKARNHGGDRLRCKCGSERIKKKVTYICMDCGEVHSEPPRFISPDDQFGIQVPEQECGHEDSYANPDSEATIVESYLIPDDQFGIQVEHDAKTNLTLLSNTIVLQDQLDPTVEDESNN